VLGLPGDRGDQRRRRGSGPDDDNALAGEVEVAGPSLRMQDKTLEAVHPCPARLVRLGVVEVALAHPQEAGREPLVVSGVAAGNLDRPQALLGGPAGRGDGVPVADVLAEVTLVDDLVEVGQNLLARGD
jgi:hypothetical protein